MVVFVYLKFKSCFDVYDCLGFIYIRNMVVRFWMKMDSMNLDSI